MFKTAETYSYFWNIMNVPLLLIVASILCGIAFSLLTLKFLKIYSYD